MVKKNKTFFTTYGWIIWALMVALMVLLYWFSFLSDEELSGFFSSDALYLPALYRDLFQDGYTLDGWTLNQASNFFPDMLLFFSLNALFGNFITAAFAYSVIQYFAFIFILYLIFRQLRPNSNLSTFALAILLFASYLFLLFIDHNYWVSSILNLNSYHNSAFLMALICFYLFLRYIENKSWKILVVLLIVSILSGACDKLFFICFTIPVSLVIIVLYFFNKDWKSLTKFLITLAAGTILAIALLLFFKNNPYFSLTKPYGKITLEYIQESWLAFSRHMCGYLTTPSFIMFLTYFGIFSYIATIISVFVNVRKLIKGKKPVDMLFTFGLFVLFFTPIVLFAPVLAGSYDNGASLRYNYFPYILLPFNFVVLISNWLNGNKWIKRTLNVTLSFLMVGYLLFNFSLQEFGKGLKHYFTFYQEKARMLDSCFSDNETLKYGITDDYWTARQVSMFSKKGIRLYFVWDGGDPWLHASNKHWFIDHDKGKHAHCEFTFLLWTKEKEIPNFFTMENKDIQPTDIGDWSLYQVAPYRYMDEKPLRPVLIDTTFRQKQ